MSVVPPIGDVDNYTMPVKGPQKVNFIRIYAAGGLTQWGTASRSVQYFLPPFKYVVWSRSSMEDRLSIAALGANVRLVYNPAVNNRWLSARLQIGSTEVMNISNLNNGYSRAVRDPCCSVEKFYGANRNDRDTLGIGKVGEPCPSDPLPGLLRLLNAAAAAGDAVLTPPTDGATGVLQENRYQPYYATSAITALLCGSQNVPSEYLVGRANTAENLNISDKFENYPGTILSCSVAMPTGSGAVLELVQDSVDKSFAACTAADATKYGSLVTAMTVTAAATMGANVTTVQFLNLCCLANDGIENAEGMYSQMLGSGVEIELPYCDQINQSIGAGDSFSTNVTLPSANRRIRFISNVLVLPSTNLRDTQCNGTSGNTNLTSAKAFINSTPDTNDILTAADGSLHAWNAHNSLAGGYLADAAAFAAHPVYISNLSGMPLPELQKSMNQGLQCGRMFNETQLIYQLTGTQDAVARTCQTYVVSGRKAIISPAGVVLY